MKSLQNVLTVSNFLLAAVASVLVFAIVDSGLEKDWWGYILIVASIVVLNIMPFRKRFKKQRPEK